jgi:UDP-N-acetylglucosamine transferase subunit ALG13
VSAPRSGATPLVLVVVGTDYHRFDRLVEWIERWQDGRGESVRCLVQHGSSRAPRNTAAKPYLGYAELQAAMAEAAAVVTHGGPASITEARSHGHLPICVPRDPLADEHVDGHQQRFARRLGDAGVVALAESEAEFTAALDAAVEGSRHRVAAAAAVPAQRPPAVALIGQLIGGLRNAAVGTVQS